MTMQDELAEFMRDDKANALVELDAKRRQRAALDLEIGQLEQAAGLARPEPWREALKAARELGREEWLSGPAPPKTSAMLTNAGELFLPAGRVGLLVAPGGTGKTTLLVQLAISVATGTPWLGTYAVTPEHAGRVLLILAEEDALEVKRKLWEGAQAVQGLARPLIGANVDVLPLAGVPCALLEVDPVTGERGAPRSSPFSLWLRALVEQAARERRPYKLIVADPLSRLAGAAADENDNNRATRLIQELEQLASVGERVTVLVAHHTNKGALNTREGTTQGAARGASALVDGARWVASLEPKPAPDDGEGWGGARSLLRVTKSNYGPPSRALELFRPIGQAIRAATPSDLARWAAPGSSSDGADDDVPDFSKGY